MKFELEIHSADDLRAFSTFLAAAAANRQKVEYEIEAAREKRLRAIGTVLSAPSADLVEAPPEPEPEPAAAPAPAEKKTRSRKAKDAPAASVSSVDNGGQTDIEDAIAATPAISTGEERIGPEDSPEVAAQDEADEKAESDAARDPEKPVTLDDVRSALGEYVRIYGMAAAQEDGPKVITLVCGEGKVKVSDVPDDKVAAVVSGVKEMSEKNPFKREKVAA